MKSRLALLAMVALVVYGCDDPTLRRLKANDASAEDHAKQLASDPRTPPDSLAAAFTRARVAHDSVERYQNK